MRIRTRGYRIAAVALWLLPACVAGRASTTEVEMLADAMHLAPGMRVADVGAGDGEFSEELARAVGAEGHVYVTEVDEDDLEGIRERLEDDGLSNFSTILGDQASTGLPENCCDAILLRLVYHHFTDPRAMRESLRAALRPGAALLVVEITPQASWQPLEGVPERDGHGITVDDLVDEMTGGGFEVVRRFDDWEGDGDHFAIVFREADGGAETASSPEDSPGHPASEKIDF